MAHQFKSAETRRNPGVFHINQINQQNGLLLYIYTTPYYPIGAGGVFYFFINFLSDLLIYLI